MNQSRTGRGKGNGGQSYRESSFWDSIDKKKKQKVDEKEKSTKIVGS